MRKKRMETPQLFDKLVWYPKYSVFPKYSPPHQKKKVKDECYRMDEP
jgi:hypothetical protein